MNNAKQKIIGILALQGSFEAHGAMLSRLGSPYRHVRTEADLAGVSGLIIPGGESSVLLKHLENNPLKQALSDWVAHKKPLMGTCAGAILLAKTVEAPTQISFGAIDAHLARNGYGRQLQSDTKIGDDLIHHTTRTLVFIRAPRILRYGPDVTVLARCEGEAVALQQGNCMIACFHPELTDDPWLHTRFLATLSSDPSAR